MKRCCLPALLSLAFTTVAMAQGIEAEGPAGQAEARKRLEQYLDQTRSLSAQFRSVLLDESGRTLAESAGTVALKVPGRFRWEYTAPSPSLLIADGESLWSFDPELEQAVVRRIDEMDAANPTRLLGGDADLDRDFVVVGSFRVDDVDWIELAPRTVASDFDMIRLGFDDGHVVMMDLGDKLGQVTRIALADVVVNEPLDNALFRFEPPPGTDVVGAP